MIITDDFVLINFPKTGSTFAREVIKRAYESYPEKNFVEYLYPVIIDIALVGQTSQHGTVLQIPEEDREKKIVSIARNPFDRYVSLFTFGWWKDHPQADVSVLEKEFPNYPNLSFFEYMRMTQKYGKRNILRASGLHLPIDIGIHSVQFIQYYSTDPVAALKIIAANEDWCKDDIAHLFPRIHFLFSERLQAELYKFLQCLGMNENSLQFIKNKERSNSSRNGDRDYRRYYNRFLIDYVLEKDRLIFEFFPCYAE